MGGIASANLYTKSFIGTKRLIEEYMDEVCNQLLYIADDQDYPSSPSFSALTELLFETPTLSAASSAIEGPDASDGTNTNIDTKPIKLSLSSKYDFFSESLQALGRSALVLSGGYSLGNGAQC